MATCNRNVPAKGIPYFTPAQDPPAGTAFDPQPSGAHQPKIFNPLRIRGVEFQNRIWVSPMCQYSAENGKFTPWHMAHLGGIFTRGPGLTMIEATAVLPNGRITPEDAGIWSDEHIKPLQDVVTFCHSQSQNIGIQLAHAGRKASTVAPWISGAPTASKEVGGWPDDVWAPSAIPYSEDYPHPKELTKEGIKGIIQAFADGAKRALKAGFDVIEIHSAHGYLLSEFLSPVSNKRTDEYGGSFENRTRLLIEIVDTVRSIIPEEMPLFVRVSATEWLEESMPNEPSWKSEDTVRLAPILYEHGVDLLDVSSGGNHPKQKIKGGPAYQAPFARDVMQSIGARSFFPSNVKDKSTSNGGRLPRLLVSTVGAITTAQVAEALLLASADVIFVGRQFQRHPGTVWQWADELSDGSKDIQIQLPGQIRWGFQGRGARTSDGKEDHSHPEVESCKTKVGSCKV
ncbi:NADPH dehydrogenase [Coprinopsis cinerea okayama7|uniref:NADPH dehydrogenase n=1 Tax=Coprinopsis cinerea (strain Okayama-7 / 130 / ATCC MYA-4618 / FGSC 9003) TaxID=240176 RepID=A8NC04_COPC7|nr:NADPH dehydrogenase [Coprinopsis cinerea okayama7\|eukprot:XP_001832304.1 NADPH dehydrogenase [Coprinopsis cinerea okayama7\